MDTPKTLLEAIAYFSNAENCRQFMISVRWADGIVKCPTCGSANVLYMAKSNLYNCRTKHPKQKFSLKVGTIFEDSAVGLDKWLPAAWLITSCKNGISSYEMARALGVTQKSAWHMDQRLREAMKAESFEKMGSPEGGEVEVDESYYGAKVKNMHYSRKLKIQQELNKIPAWKNTTRYAGKTPIMGIYDRQTRTVRAKVVPNVKRETLQKEIMNGIQLGSSIYTDQAVAYDNLKGRFIHETVNHIDHYVRGSVHTNCLENFWSLMKRNLAGTYVAVEPFHLDRYLDEQMFRFNNRKDSDFDRFYKLMQQTVGKRLTYADLTGKETERPVA